jgi:glutaredoxin
MRSNMTSLFTHNRTALWLTGFLVAACALALPSAAWALYKVVGPDGKISYTDRPPVNQPSKQIKTGRDGADTRPLPYALAQVASRFPVNLYAFKGCAPCDQGRNLLKQRGVPFTEKSVHTDADLQALVQLTGSQQMPLLRIGKQQINGYSASEWNSYLDAAGYPTASALPQDYRWPDAAPLVATAVPSSPAKTASTRANATPRVPTPPANASSGIRF